MNQLTSWLLAMFVLVSPLSAATAEDPGKPPGDTTLKGKKFREATEEQKAAVVAAIRKYCGDEAADEFEATIAGPNCKLVDVGSKSATHDATTIGLRIGKDTDLEIAISAEHEREHWGRSSEPVDTDGDGEGDEQAKPDRGDPHTNRGKRKTNGKYPNPCGPLNHAVMGVRDLKKMKTLCEEGQVTGAAKDSMCEAWEDYLEHIQEATTDAVSSGCNEARQNPNEWRGKTADQLGADTTLFNPPFDPSKPDCCG